MKLSAWLPRLALADAIGFRDGAIETRPLAAAGGRRSP